MRYIFIPILFSFVVVSCINYNSIYRDSNSIPFSKRDLNILVASAYIKRHNQNCHDTCKFLINSNFNYINSNVFNCNIIKSNIKKLKINPNDSLEIHSDYYIVGVGQVSFNKFKDKLDYTFSPLIYIPDHNLIISQVKNKIGVVSIFTCKLIGNRVYFSEEGSDNFCPKLME